MSERAHLQPVQAESATGGIRLAQFALQRTEHMRVIVHDHEMVNFLALELGALAEAFAIPVGQLPVFITNVVMPDRFP